MEIDGPTFVPKSVHWGVFIFIFPIDLKVGFIDSYIFSRSAKQACCGKDLLSSPISLFSNIFIYFHF